MLTKTRVILTKTDFKNDDGLTFYGRKDEDTEGFEYGMGIYLPNQDLDDMNNPEVLTVTIQPGDLINVDGDEVVAIHEIS